MFSMTARLLMAASIVLAGFLGLTGYALDRAYSETAEAGVRDRLQGHVFTLIASAFMMDDGSIIMPRSLTEAPFTDFHTSVFARIDSNDGRHTWMSPSLAQHPDYVPPVRGLASTETRFNRHDEAEEELFVYSFGVAWDQRDSRRQSYTFTVAETLDSYDQQISRFRRYMGGWLGGMAVLLLLVQTSILRWGLAPLRHAANELAEIEAGEHIELQGVYPKELRGLTGNLNALIHSSRENLERYRHSLSDLAHSLNTPLALLRGAVEMDADPETLRKTVREQVDRMSEIVNYQLQRAATSGRQALTAPVPVAPVVHKIRSTLEKVYADKGVSFRLEGPMGAVFYGDQGDLLELMGNLLDNAFKWSRGRVLVRVAKEGGELVLAVEDDGDGIPDKVGEDLTARGVRGDADVQGYGIGLAMVRDIVQVYKGRLQFASSPLGGARVVVVFSTPSRENA